MKKDPPVLTMDEMRSSVKVIDDINERSVKAVEDLRDINQEEVKNILTYISTAITQDCLNNSCKLATFQFLTDVFGLGSIIISATSENTTVG